jgi:transposase
MKSQKQIQLSIERFRKQGLSTREIAKRTGLSRYSVDKILNKNGNSTKPENQLNIFLEPYREKITEWLEVKKMTARLIHKRLKEKGVPVSESGVQRYLKSLKKPEVYVHVPTTPGKECQIDFGYLGKFNKEGKQVKVWVFCQVLSHSRYAFYKAVTDQTTNTFFQCQIEAMEFFGGVPATIKIDNLGAGVLEADFYQPLIQKQYADMVAHYKTTVIPCRICRGQDKGIVESGVKYVKNSFLKNLETRDLQALEGQLALWNKAVCNLREHGATRQTPNELFNKEEKRKLIPLPVKRYEKFRYELRTVNQFGHIYFQYNQYSVPSHYSGESLLIASNGKLLKIFKDDRQIAMHLVNSHIGKNITEDHHQPIHKRAKTTEYYRQKLVAIGEHALDLLEKLILTHPYEWKRMCNGIHRLGNKYSKPIVNKACYETITNYQADYRKLKSNVEKLIENAQNTDKIKNPLQGIKGYAHDLTVYDRFVTSFHE